MARAGIASPRDEAKGMYRALGAGAVEILSLAGGDGVAAAFDPTSRARWDEARRSGGVVLAASHRAAGALVIEVLDVIVPPARAGRAWIERATRDATAALERFVIANPRDWLWLHRRWRAPR